jgi:ABC-type antimicrobial peptide transport system permease subunit
MVVVEASILGIVGVVLGAIAGLAAGAVLLQMGGGIGDPGGLPWLPIGVAAFLGLLLPAVAAIYPARAAANVSIVEALHFD